MWCLNRRAYQALRVHEGGWDLSPEIKLAALRAPEVVFGQYHVDHYHRNNGASKQSLWQTGFNHSRYILRRRLTTDNNLWLAINAAIRRVNRPVVRWLYSWAS